MSRPLRIEFPGALYHITSRGDGREAIYLDDGDRNSFLTILAHVCERFRWACHSYCLMTNHYHLLIETPEGQLARGMRQLNGVYTQRFNRAHRRVGHVYQGRYTAVLVQKERHLLELARYIVLNPVRAGMVPTARDWPWSSYRATAGLHEPPRWLTTEWLRTVVSSGHGADVGAQAYRRFVQDGSRLLSAWQHLRQEIYLGDEHFIARMLARVDNPAALTEVPAVQRRPTPASPPTPLVQYERDSLDRNLAIIAAYRSGAYSMRVIGDHFGIHYSSVSRILHAAEAANSTETAQRKT